MASAPPDPHPDSDTELPDEHPDSPSPAPGGDPGRESVEGKSPLEDAGSPGGTGGTGGTAREQDR